MISTDGTKVEDLGGLGLDFGGAFRALKRDGQQGLEDFGSSNEGRAPRNRVHHKGLDHDGRESALSGLLIGLEERAFELDEGAVTLPLELGRHIQTHERQIAHLRCGQRLSDQEDVQVEDCQVLGARAECKTIGSLCY